MTDKQTPKSPDGTSNQRSAHVAESERAGVPDLESASAKLPPAPAHSRLRAFLAAWYAHLFSFFAVAGLLVVSLLLWGEWTKRFPVPPPGAYAGVAKRIVPGERDALTGLYLERQPGSSRALLTVLRSGWQPYTIEGLLADDGTSKSIAPITVNGPDGSLRFTGKADSDGGFHGKVQELRTRASGSWELAPVRDAGSIPGEEAGEVRLAILLKAELAETEAKISEAQREVPEQRAEIDHLTEFVTEGEQLRARAADKQKALTAQLSRAKQELANKQAQAARLSEQFDLSQRVSGMGRLVTLARESLEREGHWFSSVLRTEPQAPSADLDQAVERGQKILALKREIAKEREHIEYLERRREPAEAPPPPPEAGERTPTPEKEGGLRKWLPW